MYTGIKDEQKAETPDQTNKQANIISGQIEIRKLYLVSELYMLELFLASASWAKDLLRNGRNTIFFMKLLLSRRPVLSTDQAIPSCLYLRISCISMEQHYFYFFVLSGF